MEENEELNELRNGTGTFSMYLFDGIEILKSLIKNENGQISNELGLYYISIKSGYGDTLNEQYGDVEKLAYKYLIKAYKEYTYYDLISWELLGRYYYNNREVQEVGEAFNIFHRLVKKENDNPEINFTYGLMLYNNQDYKEAIPYLEIAIKNYTRNDYKIDAISLLGSVYYKLELYA